MDDFYTLNTSVDLGDAAALDHFHLTLGFITQATIMGSPHHDEEGFFLRFAVRPNTLSMKEEDFLTLLCMGSEFTSENTSLTRADRL